MLRTSLLAIMILVAPSAHADILSAMENDPPEAVRPDIPSARELYNLPDDPVALPDPREYLELEGELLDVLWIKCMFNANDPNRSPCVFCIAPGRTHELPVEVQGSGYAVGVPGMPGYYFEIDVVEQVASC